MTRRVDTWTVFAATSLLVGTLLACKKKKPDPVPVTTSTAPATAAPTQAPTLPDKLYKLGETGKAFDYSLLVEKVTECKRRFSVPKKGNIFIGVEATVENISQKQFHASPTHAKIVDGQNLTYNSLGYASTTGCDPLFKFTQLANGEKVKGWLVFEIPKDSTNLKMSYNPTIIGTPQTLKFDLGR